MTSPEKWILFGALPLAVLFFVTTCASVPCQLTGRSQLACLADLVR